jgi:16S rRNA processing protein RimM
LKSGPEALVAIGKIVKPFGIEGYVVVQAMTDSTARFRSLTKVSIGAQDKGTRPYALERAVIEKRGVRLKLDGVDDRTTAELLVGMLLFVPEQERVRPPRGRVFVHDVIGMNVVDETRGAMGVVRDVLKYPAHDVYVVDWPGGSYMIPAVKEVVLRFDVVGRELRVRLVDGLVEENEGEVA